MAVDESAEISSETPKSFGRGPGTIVLRTLDLVESLSSILFVREIIHQSTSEGQRYSCCKVYRHGQPQFLRCNIHVAVSA